MFALSMTVLSVLGIILAIGLIALFYWSCKSFEGIFAVVLFFFCLDALTVGLPVFSVGKNIQIFDPLAIVAFLAGVARLAFGARERLGAPQWLLISLFLLMAVPLAIGFSKFGMAAAPDFRFFFHFLAFALYASSFDIEEIDVRRLTKYAILAGATLAALVYFRWTAEAAGLSIARSWFHVGAGRRFRVLNAAQAYVLAQAALLFLMTRTSPGTAAVFEPQRDTATFSPQKSASLHLRSSMVIAGLGLATSIALMHRSVWASLLLGIAMLAFLQPERRTDFVHMSLASVLLGLIVLVPLGLFGYLDAYFMALLDNVVEVGEHHSSFANRYFGWQTLLRDWAHNGDVLTYTLGQPFGSGYYRRLSELGMSVVNEYTPHNFYVQTLLRTGVIGVGILLLLIVVTGIRAYRTAVAPPQRDGRTTTFRQFLLLCVVMQTTFMLAYGARLEQGLFFGLAMAAASSAKRVCPRHLDLKAV